jgi:ABC-2 type transport system ATP-binding protein
MATYPATGVPAAPVVIEVRSVDKTFRIPAHKVDSFKERALHPLRQNSYRELRALRDISFDVHQGEFFGIVGRNGSGKSTLLKVMSSIYRADGGRIRMAGRLAPFIELGVGFNAELTSRENVVLNGVLMGLGRREAQRRMEAVLDFAELRDFVDLRLKNYSSGMLVRLAFAVMVQADADIMLVDEVLAVGDAAFAQKCLDVFREKRRSGNTLVLVTHDMATVQEFCHRAMLIHDGELLHIGDPEDVALRYYRLNFAGEGERAATGGVPDVNVRIVDGWLENAVGERVENVEQGEPLHLKVVYEARHDLEAPAFGFHVINAAGETVFGFSRHLEEGGPSRMTAGQRVQISARVENTLVPGRYFIHGAITRNRRHGDLALHMIRLLEFVVYGTHRGPGSVSVRADIEAVVEPAEATAR